MVLVNMNTVYILFFLFIDSAIAEMEQSTPSIGEISGDRTCPGISESMDLSDGKEIMVN